MSVGSRLLILAGVAFTCLAGDWSAQAQPKARIVYVDGSLTSSCNTYSLALRNCGGRDGRAFTTIQAASDVVMPGDRVLVRGGLYPLSSARAENVLSRSGTESHPISFEGYESEKVIIRGVGFEDRDLNGDGDADGPEDKGARSALIRITGSFIHVRKMEVERGPYMGVQVEGSDNVVEEVTSRHNWMVGILVRGARNRLEYVEAHHNRHGHGIGISVRRGGPVPSHNEIRRSLSHDNGREANDKQVLPIPGDPAGGGNSDGIGSFKTCIVRSEGSLCSNEHLAENIVWKNVDDGFDVTLRDSWVVGNVSIENGPAGRRGIKVLSAVASGQVFSGNVVIGLGVQFRALELRGAEGLDVFHNLALNNVDRGVYIVSNVPNSRMHNNVGYLNREDIGSRGVNSHNWSTTEGNPHWRNPSTAEGNPRLRNLSTAIDLSLQAGSVQERWRRLMDQVIAAYSPEADSGLVDAGLLVPGFHCPLPDDRGQDSGAPCRHWMGKAPDIGPFEFGIQGNPDRR